MSTISSVARRGSRLLLKSLPMIGRLAQHRNRGGVVLRDVVQQAGNRERLPIAQLDVRLGAPRDQRGDAEPARA